MKYLVPKGQQCIIYLIKFRFLFINIKHMFYNCFFLGAWSRKDVHPQEWEAPLCRRQKYHLLCSSPAGAHGHHCWECIQVWFTYPFKYSYSVIWDPFVHLTPCIMHLSVRTRCIWHETSTYCLCLGGACCVSRGWRSWACWALSSISTSTSWTWFPTMGTCCPWNMKVLSGCVQLIHLRYVSITLLLCDQNVFGFVQTATPNPF